MVDKRESSTEKVAETSLGLTLASSSVTQPIAYSDNVWDVVEDGSRLAVTLNGAGQYDQHTINEQLARGASTSVAGAHQYEYSYNGNTESVPYGVSATSTSLTITAAVHGCESTPFVTCYQDGAVVEFAVSKNAQNDIVVSWNGIGSVTAQHPVTVCVMGGSSNTVPALHIEDGSEGDVLQIDGNGAIVAAPLQNSLKQYVFVCKNYANITSVTVTAESHGCGTFPIVACYSKTTENNAITYEAVGARVTVNVLGDVTVTWQTSSYVSESNPLYISIVGAVTNVVVEQDSGNNSGEQNEDPIDEP